MKHIIKESKNPKTLDDGGKVGGFNILNIPDDISKQSGDFWSDFNKPLLDKVIERGAISFWLQSQYKKNYL